MQEKTKILTARVTPDELREITAQARATTRTRSEYLRGIIYTLKVNPDLRREIRKNIAEANK